MGTLTLDFSGRKKMNLEDAQIVIDNHIKWLSHTGNSSIVEAFKTMFAEYFDDLDGQRKSDSLMEMSLREIQQGIAKWGLQQFGPENKSLYVGDPACGTPMGSLIQLCGAFTELAEIMRPMIEMHQGRWNKSMTEQERHDALREAYRDGAADLLIWFCHWASLNHVDLQEVLNEVWQEKVSKRTRDNWESDKAKEDQYKVLHSEVYRESCCEAMESDWAGPKWKTPSLGYSSIYFEGCTPANAEAQDQYNRLICMSGDYAKPLKSGLAPKKTFAPSAGVCINPTCKTKFSDRVPYVCPECGFAQTVQQQG